MCLYPVAKLYKCNQVCKFMYQCNQECIFIKIAIDTNSVRFCIQRMAVIAQYRFSFSRNS